MKEGWEYKTLGEVATYINGFPFKPSDWGTDGLPIIRIQNLTGTQQLFNKCSRNDIPEKYIVRNGDVLISWSATLGVFEWKLDDAFLNQHIFKVVFDKVEINKRYFEYAILISINIMSQQTNGATMKHIRKGDFDNIEIPVPPLSEQQRIVDYLDSAFAKIDAMKANAEKRLNEAKALFQASLKEMLEPKEGWEEKSMKEIVHPDCSLSYGIVQPGEHIDDGVPVVRPVDFNNKVIVRVEGLKRTKKEISDAYKRTILKGGEILLCVRGTTGTMGLASDELQGCNVTRGIVPIFFDEHANKMFVYYQLLSPKLQTEIQKKTTGAALKQINIKDLRALHLFFPSLSEQQAIVETLNSLKSKVDRLQANYEKISQECDALKQAILRQVFE